jgi:hypothetical protein
MVPEGLLPCFQEPASGPYLVPDIVHALKSFFFKIHCNIILSRSLHFSSKIQRPYSRCVLVLQDRHFDGLDANMQDGRRLWGLLELEP